MAETIYSVKDLVISNTLPPSIADDEQLQAIAYGLDIDLIDIAMSITTYLPYMTNLFSLPDRILNLLAWQYHVDGYDAFAPTYDRQRKVQTAIADHRRHGTLSAVKDALFEVFGNDYEIVEWWQNTPKHEPYTFRVFIHTSFGQPQIERAMQLLGYACNVRSHWVGYVTWDELDAINWTWDELDAKEYTWDELDGLLFRYYIN
jgi:phage tail P2-like protein